jgi:Tol biopolymer transport system component
MIALRRAQMRWSWLQVTLTALALAGSLALVPSAQAIYGPAAGGFGADIVSVDNASDEQGNAPTTDADISADGHYVVFETEATNFFEDDGGVVEGGATKPDAEPPGTLREGGIFRYDRITGAIQLVADGTEIHTEGPEKDKLVFQGAQSPSVSADGRYVVFSTAQQLVPQDTNENVDVYERDMSISLTADRKSSNAYALVSAKDGGDEPAVYAPRESPLTGAEPGADVWPNTSISADGRYALFRTTELDSNLPNRPTADTPPQQLFVRDLKAKTTTLLSLTSAGHKPQERCLANGALAGGEPACGAIGPATLSADGSTVAWVSENAPEQTSFLPGEPENSSEPYYLWRRWQEPNPVTRRITGIADPDDPECRKGEGVTLAQTAEGPCYGPLSEPESSLASIALTAPALSGDGYTVVFLAGAASRPNITKSSGLDLFITSMAPGVTRKAGTRELTLGVQSGNIGSTPSIESVALSPDGSTIAFTSLRDSFVLPEPLPVGAFRPFPTVSDLYVVHLAEGTLERAVVNYAGGDPNGSVSVGPTLSQDGSVVAFTSSSVNLIPGDANEASDAFTAMLEAPAGTAAPSTDINATQDGFSLTATALPELGLHVKRAKDGGLIVLVETPGAGKLTARAGGMVTTKVGKKAHRKSVVLARASGVVRAEETATLVMRLASKFVKDLKRVGKLKALVTVAYTPSAPAEALSAEVNATFVATRAKKAGSKALVRRKKA